MPPSDLLSALLDPVRAAGREDSMQALDARNAPTTRSAPHVYQRALAHAPSVGTATVERCCRQRRITIVHAYVIRLFDVGTVGCALQPTGRTGT